MAVQETLVRQEYLYHIADFCRKLAEALGSRSLSCEQIEEIFRISISAECVSCSIQVSGQELFAISQSPSAERANAKTGRLRLGDCARQGCAGCYYRFSFDPCENFDWQTILVEVDAVGSAHAEEPAHNRAISWALILQSKYFVRAVFGIAILAVFLLGRQWYQGGQIPLLRQAEHFHVDSVTEESN